MKGFIVWVLFAFAVVCRAAAGGEGALAAVPGDPATVFWRVLFDNGPLGLFLAYMLHRENKRDLQDVQNRDAEEKRRDAMAERFRQLDERFLGVIEKYAFDAAEVQLALQEIRAGVGRIAGLLAGQPGDGNAGGAALFRKDR